MLYVQDYDELFPCQDGVTTTSMLRPDGTTYAGRLVWPLQAYPYVKNLGIYTCPSDPNPRLGSGGVFAEPVPLSYGINERMFLSNVMGMPAMPLAAINFPADTYYIADVYFNFAQLYQGSATTNNPFTNAIFNRIRFHKDCGDLTISGGGLGVRPNPTNPDACTRHQGGGLVVFTDGHAKWIKWPAYEGNKSVPTRTTL